MHASSTPVKFGAGVGEFLTVEPDNAFSSDFTISKLFQKLLLRSGIGTSFLGDLQLADVVSLRCTSRKIREACHSFAGVVAFAHTRPYNGCHHRRFLQSLSLRAWAGVFADCAATLREFEWGLKTFTTQLTRTHWTAAAAKVGGVLVHIDMLPSGSVFPLLQSMWLDCLRHGGFEDVDLHMAPDFSLDSGGLIVLALKATFAYVEDCDAIPEFGLVCLMILGNGRFAFMCMSDPRRSWIQIILSNSLQILAARVKERFGARVWEVDAFGQLPWVQGKPALWFERGMIQRNLVNLRAAIASYPAHRLHDDAVMAYAEFREKYGTHADTKWVEATPLGCSRDHALWSALRTEVKEKAPVLSEHQHAMLDPPTSTSSSSVEETLPTTMEDIAHQDPPAIVDEHEAAEVCRVQWIGHIERLAKDSIATEAVISVDETGPQLELRVPGSDNCARGSTSSNGRTMSASPQTAPGGLSTPHCLLPHTRVEIRPGQFIGAGELQVDDDLFSASGHAVVSAVRMFPARDRDIVVITFSSDEQLQVTASHALAVYRPRCNKIQPILASDVCQGDRLCTSASAHSAMVKHVSKFVINTNVIEIELRDGCKTMYITTGHTAVEAYGATYPKLKDNQVKILHFNRNDQFRQSLLENEELEACRQAMARRNISSDLAVYGLGLAKMFVQADLAEKALEALASRDAPKLTGSDVVVSSDFEAIVKLAVNQRTQRTIYVRRDEILELPSTRRELRTFLEMASSASGEESGIVCSTTDGDERKGVNPRKKLRALPVV